MRVQISFKSTDAAVAKLNELANEVEKYGAGRQDFLQDTANSSDSVFSLEFADEGDDEFDPPSAAVLDA